MDDFEIIDAHTHLSRSIEEEANYMLFPGRRTRDRWGTPERAMEYMERYGISKMVFLTSLPAQYRRPLCEKAKLLELTERQRRKEEKRISEQIGPMMRKFNEWGCKVGQRFPRLIPFSCISKELGDARAMVEEVELRASQGAKGIKFHPGAYYFFPDDKELWPVYEKCQELGLPIIADSAPWNVSHILTVYPHPLSVPTTGQHIDYAEPKNWDLVLEAFPRLTVVLAHLGSAWWDERVELANKYSNVYFDTAQGFAAPDRIPFTPHRSLAEEDVMRVFHKIGTERIMFGTDFPGVEPQPQWEQLLRLPLTYEEKQMIFSENAKRILRI